MIVFDETKQNEKLTELRRKEEEELAQTMSGHYNIGYIDLASAAINSDALRVISESDARGANAAVFDILEKKLKIAVLSPENPRTQGLIQQLTGRGYQTSLYMASIDSLEKVWKRYKELSYSEKTRGGALDISNEQINSLLESINHIPDVKKLIDELLAEKKGYRISSLLEIIVAGALALKASDIHIEPEEKIVRVRYRLDGVLTAVSEFTGDVYRLLLSRLKLLSGMKLNVGTAQDGRFSIVVKDSEIEVRSSILPSAYAESVVLRVLNPKSISVPLEELGMAPKLLKILEKEINKPEGMILTTGPTGSGKTTTLYAFLKKVHTPDIKIITIENPVEYHLPGIVQTQTDEEKGYTFLEGLRSALRQDPDIIMVGEIRDQETATIAINAALTGHLVFSTLHTNSAAGTFPRLIDLKINPKIITSALSVAMAQRLVRKLCPDCRKAVVLEGKTKTLVERIVSGITDPADKPAVPGEIFEPVGCIKCNNTGYRGRIGLYEAIVRSEAVEKAINQNPSEREIWKAAADQKILTMRQDGIVKVIAGITSIAELERVIDLEESW
jgi:type IV pilus assembly protein PilB